MNKVFKSKIVWVSVGVIAILLVIKAYQYVTQPIIFIRVPPSAVLQIQGNEQKGDAWEYSWEGDNSDNFLFTAYTSNTALVTTSPFSAILKFTADTPPQSIRIEVVNTATLSKPKEESFENQSYFAWNGRSFANNAILTKDLDLKNEQSFTLELKRGLYIITILAKWTKGEANYSFLIKVK